LKFSQNPSPHPHYSAPLTSLDDLIFKLRPFCEAYLGDGLSTVCEINVSEMQDGNCCATIDGKNTIIAATLVKDATNKPQNLSYRNINQNTINKFQRFDSLIQMSHGIWHSLHPLLHNEELLVSQTVAEWCLLGVDPAYMNHHIGSQLCQFQMDQLSKYKLIIASTTGEISYNLFTKLGFVEAHRFEYSTLTAIHPEIKLCLNEGLKAWRINIYDSDINSPDQNTVR